MPISNNKFEKVACGIVMTLLAADSGSTLGDLVGSNPALQSEAKLQAPVSILMFAMYGFACFMRRRDVANGVVASRFALEASKAITYVPYSQFPNSYISITKIAGLAIFALLPQAYLARKSRGVHSAIGCITILALIHSVGINSLLDGYKGEMTFVDVNTGMLVTNASCGSLFKVPEGTKAKDYFDSGDFWLFWLSCLSIVLLSPKALLQEERYEGASVSVSGFLGLTSILVLIFMTVANFLAIESVQQNNCNQNAYVAGGIALGGSIFYLGGAVYKSLSETYAPSMVDEWGHGGVEDSGDELGPGDVVIDPDDSRLRRTMQG
jgi:hypothetical protein